MKISKADYDELVRLRDDGFNRVFETSDYPQKIMAVHEKGYVIEVRKSRPVDYVKFEQSTSFIREIIAEYENEHPVVSDGEFTPHAKYNATYTEPFAEYERAQEGK